MATSASIWPQQLDGRGGPHKWRTNGKRSPFGGGVDLIEVRDLFHLFFVLHFFRFLIGLNMELATVGRIFRFLIGLNMEDLTTVGSGAMGPLNRRWNDSY